MRGMNRLTVDARALLAMLVLAATGCSVTSNDRSHDRDEPRGLVGAWRSKVQFSSGAFAEVKDLEFLYVFNDGGTMTESSNYDASPPVPPAYGVWRQVWPGQFEAKYIFYTTKPPTKFEEISGGNGWSPAGYGELTEQLSLAPDGQTFTSTIRYAPFDASGKPATGGGSAEGRGTRIHF
jgi:hypothetical protein